MQQYYRYLTILAAVALFGAGLLIAQAFHSEPPPPPALLPQQQVAIPTSQVLVAKADLKAGQFLQESDFSWRERPTNSLRPDLYVKGADSTATLQGAVVLHPVNQGEAIQRSDVISPRDRGFLAAVLAPDKRSITVAVDEVTGSAGLILPGDRVDILVTHTGAQADNPARQVVGQLVLEDVRVIAVDQTLRGPSEEIKADGGKDDKRATRQGGSRSDLARTVTLEVTPREAEIVAVATNLGKLSLILRSLSRVQTATAPSDRQVVWAGDVMQALYEMGGAAPAAVMPVAAPAPAVLDVPPPPSMGVVVLRGGGGGQK